MFFSAALAAGLSGVGLVGGLCCRLLSALLGMIRIHSVVWQKSRDRRDHSGTFLPNPSGKRYHSWKFLLDRKLVAPGGGKNTGQAVDSADRRTNRP